MESGKRKREDGPSRITYTAGDRTFERLFKEASLGEMKQVARRKLVLPSHATIRLKQLRDGKSIDLDDDDDFDAFCALARSVMSVDVAVEVSVDVSPPMVLLETLGVIDDQPPEDADTGVETEPPPKKRKKVSEESVPTKKSAKAKDASSTQVLVKPAEKLPTGPADGQPPKRKPKPVKADASGGAIPTEVVSKRKKKPPTDFADEQSPKQPETAETSEDVTTTQVVTEPAEKAPIDEQPPKKKPRTAKADASKNAVKTTEKRPNKTKKAADANDSNDAIDASVVKRVGESSMIKKTVARKSRSKVGGERSVNHTDNGLASSEKTKVKGKHKEKEIEAQASELAADTRGSCVSDFLRSIPCVDIPIDATITSEMEGEAEPEDPNDMSHSSASSPPSVVNTVSSSPLCHICSLSFHPLYRCPTVLAGREAVQNKIEELKKAGASEHQLAIKDLESLLNSFIFAKPSASNAAQKDLKVDNVSERGATKSADKSGPHSQPSWTPLVPSNSLLSEVTVESRHEGSSSEEEDGFGQEMEQEERNVGAGQPSFDDVDLDAIMRGPTPIKLHNLILNMVSKDQVSDIEDEGDDMGPLEMEDDDVVERRYRRPSQPFLDLSEEQEDDEDDGDDNGSEQNVFKALLSFGGSELSMRHNGSILQGSAGSGTDVILTPDTDDTRVSVSGAPGSNKDLTGDGGAVTKASDLNKPPDTLPTGGTSLPHDATDNDPIEPADDLVESSQDGTFDIDPIEPTTPPSLKATTPLPTTPTFHSTPKNSVVKRMKNRHGQCPSPSQISVRVDEPEVCNPLMVRNTKVAARRDSHKLSICDSTVDLPRVSSQPVGRGGVSAKMNGHATPFHSQPLPKASMSLAKWDSIREPSPSSTTNDVDRSSPLPGGPGGILDELVSNASDEDNSERGEKKTAAKTRGSTYRKLSDIAASQHTLFSQRTAVAPHLSPMASRKVSQTDGEDEETSSSDSDSASQSHIPEANRAGKLRSKKSNGLLRLRY